MIRAAIAADAPKLATFEDSFPRRRRWSETGWLQEIEGPGRLVEVVDLGEVVAAASWRIVDVVCDLDRIVVAPSHRGQGWARKLMARGLAWAASQGGASLMLEVEADNQPAIALYRSFGLVPVAIRHHYYGSESHALIMEVEIP